MPSSKSHAVRVSKHAKAPPKSRPRAQFDTLIKQLETERKRLAAWHDAIPLMRARADAELMPIGRQYDARCRELAFMFDKASESKQINKKEREKLSDLICSLIINLLDDDDDELVALFEKHTWSGDEDLKDDPEFAAFSEMMEQLLVSEDPFAWPGDEPEAGPSPLAGKRKSKAKKQASRKETAQEARQAAEELRLQQSIRDIFRKLTSSLHPDREQDPAERDRKTALMQRVNVAYTNKDLLGLLELQFEIDQIDQAGLDTLPEDRIKQYNKLLTRQVTEVRHDIAELEHWLLYELRVPTRGRVTPAAMEKALSAEIANFQKNLAAIERDLRDFQDMKVLKAFLKTYRIPDMQEMFGNDFF